MAHRHKVHKGKNDHDADDKYAKGGGVTPKRDASKDEYDAQSSKVMKEAHEMKRGGKAHGHKGKHRLDKKARGGHVKASGRDMKSSPFSAAHTGHGGNAAENPSAHLPKGEK